jgi:putative spermidine/putrescine transport system ATP-binding protein
MATLELIGLSKHFVGANAVNDVNLSVGDGEFLCILGPSGCGKTTTLRMIGGFEEPTSGDVRIDGQSVVNLPPNRRPTAMVFQKYTLWPHMRVYDNIAFGLRLRHMPKAEIDRQVQDALALVGLVNYGDRYPAQLSGGEQQRVALARALVLRPKILLLDEPFSNLDALLRVRLREELHAIQRRIKITAIFVTHDQEEALSLADRIAVMHAGRLEQLDKPSQIYAHPRTLFVADFIGVMNLLPAVQEGNRLRVGQYTLRAPQELNGSEQLTIAVRPEDLSVTAETDSSDSRALWKGIVDQSIDLGHYRKVLVVVPGLLGDEQTAIGNRLKVYVPKATDVREGDRIALYPNRYLVYADQVQPVQVLNAPDANGNETRRNDLSGIAVSAEQLRNAG